MRCRESGVAALILTAGMARANEVVMSLNFGQGNLDGWAALTHANAAAGLTTIPPHGVALYKSEDDPVDGILSRAGHAAPLSIQFSGKAFENPIFATPPFAPPVMLPPAAATSRTLSMDNGLTQSIEPAAAVPLFAVAYAAPPIPPPLLSIHPDGASPETWFQTGPRNYADWSIENPWIYEPEPVPEPGTLAVISLGLALLALRGRLPFGRRSRSRDLD